MKDHAVSRRRRSHRRTIKSASGAGAAARRLPSPKGVVRLLPSLVYLSVLIMASWLLYYSVNYSFFTVREISVTGNRLLEAEQARQATNALGENLLLLKTPEIEQSLQRVSVVETAQAALSLPGQLEVTVKERTPVLRWQVRDGSFLVDREGVVFSREAPRTAVMLVRDLNGPALDLGSRIDASVLFTITTLVKLLPEKAGLLPPWFDYARGTGVSVPLESGPRVLFGDAEDLDSKLASLASIQQHLETTKARAEVIDLRFRGRPTYVLPPPPAPDKQPVASQVRR